MLYLFVYVDDVILMSTEVDMIGKVKMALKNLYKMEDKGNAEYFLGVEIRRKM